jgi:hypothetical protein
MKRVADVFILGGFVGVVLAVLTRLASRDVMFPALQLPAQTYLDFGWTSFLIAAVLLLRQLRDK